MHVGDYVRPSVDLISNSYHVTLSAMRCVGCNVTDIAYIMLSFSSHLDVFFISLQSITFQLIIPIPRLRIRSLKVSVWMILSVGNKVFIHSFILSFYYFKHLDGFVFL